MSHFPQYSVNPTNTETNQFNMQALDVNMLKNLFENNNNVLTQNINPQDVSYLQQNKIPGQYILVHNNNVPIQLPNNNTPIQQPYMQMMPFPYGNIYYVNPASQLAMNESGVQQYNGAPLQLTNGIMQVDVNDLSKLSQQNTTANPNPTRSRKRSYSNQIKQETETLNDQNEEVQRDTRNRPLLYSCPDCSRKFSMQSRLTQHKKCHSGIRPFACSSCSFAFTQKSYLVRHAAVHKEERPYVCELCQKTYKHYGSLANHRKTHKNGQKPVDRLMTNADNGNRSSANCKPEEIVDINNNNNKSYIGGNNAEFMFQNRNSEPNQSYNTQFSTDMSSDPFSHSFESQLSTSLPSEINPSFINQLAFNNGNFYALNFNAGTASDAAPAVKIELAVHQDTAPEAGRNSAHSNSNNNNNSISIESSSQPINLT